MSPQEESEGPETSNLGLGERKQQHSDLCFQISKGQKGYTRGIYYRRGHSKNWWVEPTEKQILTELKENSLKAGISNGEDALQE